MTLQPLWDEGALTAAHALAATAAILIGAIQLAAPKGGLPHRALGRVWVGVMGFVALSSFWIYGFRMIGPFSVIHLLSALTLVMLTRSVLDARARRIPRHAATMTSLYVLALLVTGLFTLWPGRAMHAVFFGPG